MSYTRVNWQDGSGGGTPVDAANLNVMDAYIATLDSAVAALQANTSAQTLQGGPIITYHSGSNTHVDGIQTETPASSGRSILFQTWDGSAQHNAFSIGSAATVGAAYVADNGQITAPAFHGNADSATNSSQLGGVAASGYVTVAPGGVNMSVQSGTPVGPNKYDVWVKTSF